MKKKTGLRLGGPALASAMALTLGAANAQAADDQSWLCRYLPAACGSESDPGGLPGHTGGGSPGEPAASETRGLGGEESPPAAAAPAPTPAPDPAPAPDAAPKTEN